MSIAGPSVLAYGSGCRHVAGQWASGARLFGDCTTPRRPSSGNDRQYIPQVVVLTGDYYDMACHRPALVLFRSPRGNRFWLRSCSMSPHL